MGRGHDVRASLEQLRIGFEGQDRWYTRLCTIEHHLRFSNVVLVPVGRDVARIEFRIDVVRLGERHERLGKGGDELCVVVRRG